MLFNIQNVFFFTWVSIGQHVSVRGVFAAGRSPCYLFGCERFGRFDVEVTLLVRDCRRTAMTLLSIEMRCSTCFGVGMLIGVSLLTGVRMRTLVGDVDSR